MSQSADHRAGVPTPGSPDAVLSAARNHQRAVVWGEAGLLASAVEWASMHEPTDLGEAASWWEAGQVLPLAGAGAPEICEFAVAEFATALGLSTDAGRRLIGHALELAHRLPGLWGLVQEGRVPVWRARRVAEATMMLSRAGAGFVDRQVAAVVGRVSVSQLDALILEAKIRCDGVEREDPENPSPDVPDTRHVQVHTDQVSFTGTCQVSGELDVADALHLDQALAAGAEQLRIAGSTESLDARRATALGEMSRAQLAMSFEDTAEPVVPTPVRTQRPVTLFLHLSEAALTGEGRMVGRCENTRTPLDADTIRAWCGHPDATVTVKPVFDLNGHVRVDQYEVPDRLKDLVDHRDGHCVFPWCTRPARRCDHDHVVRFDETDPDRGPTCGCNLAPLCRSHHRLKTHTPWRYAVIEPGTYLWSTPHGYRLLVDETGTRDVSPEGLPMTANCLHLIDSDDNSDGDPDPPDQ